MTRLLLLSSLFFLAACTHPVEMPENSGAGTDEMKRSPCACAEVPFNAGGYTWAG